MNDLDSVFANLDRLRRGLKGWIAVKACLAVVAVVVWILVLFAMTDWAFQLAVGWRLLAFAGLIGGVGATVWMGTKVLIRGLSDEYLSVCVESVQEISDNRLINAVQFARSGDDRQQAFSARLFAQNPVDIRGVKAIHLYPTQLLKMFGIGCVLGLLIAGIMATLNPEGFRTSLARLAMPWADIDPYSLTRLVEVSPGEVMISKGTDVTVVARFEGVMPKDPWLQLLVGDMPVKRLDLEPVDNEKGVYAIRTPVLYESAECHVGGGDAKSQSFNLTVAIPPVLTDWSATVMPPEYTGAGTHEIGSAQETNEVLAGSTMTLSGTSSYPLVVVHLRQGKHIETWTLAEQTTSFTMTTTVATTEPMAVKMVSAGGLVEESQLPMSILPDMPPAIQLGTEERRMIAQANDELAIPYIARDEFGVRRVSCELLDARTGSSVINHIEAKERNRKEVTGSLSVSLARLKARPGSRFRLRLVAEDFGPTPESRQGRSAVLEVVVPLPVETNKEKETDRKKGEVSVARLIQLQQDNLKETRAMERQVAGGSALSVDARQGVLVKQVEIRDLAKELLNLDRTLGDLQPIIKGLVELEMSEAIRLMDQLTRAAEKEMAEPLKLTIAVEVKILSQLRGMPDALRNEFDYQDKADLLAVLQKLHAGQKGLLAETKGSQNAGNAGDLLQSLVDRQEELADGASAWMDAARRLADEQAEDDFARQLGEVHTMLAKGKLYVKMLTAAEQLSEVNWAAGIQTEEECLALLSEALRTMNRWRLDKAKKTLAEASKTLADVSEQLSELEDRQKQIVEITRDLTKRGQLDDEVREELGKMDEEQKEWLAKLEKMAQDLYQFPELPVSNDLNSKMREIFEDTEQAAGSEHAPTVEIAVQKEDGLLEAIKNTKERVEDVEMWLPDVPDNIKWDLESFDAGEFPEMPLVDLPDELEDIVGDLLDQDADIDAMSQDSTGNQMMADAEMGWGVMDGPMPNFSAKGKSGNTKPNDNEMTGRSGAGREGQSTGELIENKVKGLEGRETHARKTNDALQKGQVEEEEGSTLDARATGGGKLGGESENIGMFGNSPRRDNHMQPGGSSKPVRQEAEALYATARLLYLNNTRNLGEATETMRLVERTDRNQKTYDNLQQRVLKRLQDSHTELATGAVLPLSVSSQQTSGGDALQSGVDLDDVDESFRDIVSDYYKNLGE